jgi:hypothetical protein
MTESYQKEPLFMSVFAYSVAKALGDRWDLWLQSQLADPLSSPVEGFRTLGQAMRLGPDVTAYIDGSTYVTRARSRAAGKFLASGCDVWLTCDDDVLVEKEGIAALVRACRSTRGVVSVPLLIRGGTGACWGNVPMNPATIVEADGVSLFPIETTGMGLVAIHREVLNAIAPNVPVTSRGENDGMVFRAFFTETIRNETWVGEDYHFCILAREAGKPVHLVLDVEGTHAGRTCKLGKDLYLSVGDEDTAAKLRANAATAKEKPTPSP